MGAALYVLHHVLGEPRVKYDANTVAFAGYCEPELQSMNGLDYDTRLVERIVDALVAGKVVALAHGKAESGPRALGHRSLLADPRTMASKDRLNAMKGRESWRPVAPVVLRTNASRYFRLIDRRAFNFMTLIAATTEEMRKVAPAGVHLDGSARVQVTDTHSFLGRLVEAFGQATGVPILCNTSLNSRGQAMANTAQDAIDSATFMGADVIVVGDRVVRYG